MEMDVFHSLIKYLSSSRDMSDISLHQETNLFVCFLCFNLIG